MAQVLERLPGTTKKKKRSQASASWVLGLHHAQPLLVVVTDIQRCDSFLELSLIERVEEKG
jgi:hypothetical protein